DPTNDNLCYVVTPHVAAASVDVADIPKSLQFVLGFDEPQTVLDKQGQCFREFSEALKTGYGGTRVAAEAATHYMARFILDPIVGDASLRNVLVVEAAQPYAVG